MLDLVYRPIDQWPGEPTTQRQTSPFSAKYEQTEELLDKELRLLGADRRAVLQVALDERDFRVDGTPKMRAVARHPGVILAFESVHGPIKVACDRFPTWDDNVRAIALGLEALRRVERYGIGTRGEQYTGYRALGPATAMGAPMSAGEAARVLLDLGDEDHLLGYFAADVMMSAAIRDELWTIAVRINHPDTGGNADLFRRANEARAVLQGATQ